MPCASRIGCVVLLLHLLSLLCVQGQVLYYLNTLQAQGTGSVNALDLKTLRNTTIYQYPSGDVVTGGVAIGLSASSTQLFWADQTLGQVRLNHV